jgi:hypothetical protein
MVLLKNQKTMKNKLLGLSLLLVSIVLINSCEVADDLINGRAGELEGDWACSEDSEIVGPTNYTVSISAEPGNSNGIIIDDFYNVGISVNATISGNFITIPSQVEGGFTVSGSGFVTNGDNEINLSYTVGDSGGQPDNVTAVYTR